MPFPAPQAHQSGASTRISRWTKREASGVGIRWTTPRSVSRLPQAISAAPSGSSYSPQRRSRTSWYSAAWTMGTAEGSSSRLTSQLPSASDGGRNAGGAQRVRSWPSRHGMPRRSTGSSSRARTSMYSRPAWAATCWAIWDLAHPGGPQTIAGWRASTSNARVSASSLGRSEYSAEMVSGSDMTDSGRDRKAWRERPPGYPAFARDSARLRLSAARDVRSSAEGSPWATGATGSCCAARTGWRRPLGATPCSAAARAGGAAACGGRSVPRKTKRWKMT